MKKKDRKLRKICAKAVLVMLTGTVLVFAGCGEALVAMTDEEEAKITTYAAHIVSKYNKSQPDGLTRVFLPEEEETAEAAEEPVEEGASEPEESSTEGFFDPEDYADVPTTTGTNMDAIDVKEDTGAVPMALADVIGIPGFDMQWTGTEVADDYMDPSGATLATPNAGKRYVILTVKVTNLTDTDLLCNVAELVPEFKLYPNGGAGITASQMLISTDFPTMNETVPAAETVERKIFFQRKASDISDSDTYALEVTLNGVVGAITQQ